MLTAFLKKIYPQSKLCTKAFLAQILGILFDKISFNSVTSIDKKTYPPERKTNIHSSQSSAPHIVLLLDHAVLHSTAHHTFLFESEFIGESMMLNP